ncbi:ABC-2 type transport system ATP-binding protein [Dyadobacter jejuensis]|uniref:ABC-2 type transport system ATP-binding protein n=1 Tax=Dyadobacter jejuensis TaxID=1082580 RepID=A0A316AA58_9BACT|nr:ABC transporter ATP-binding protein [Dyadobacter jejuensis]PWJ53754.1 ABC-2 type transport system ATP-binding protein [Dyadobacter jejuensis]
MKVSIQGVSKSYQQQEVLNIPELELESGKITGIVGNNGAGKTTLLRAILDLIQLDRGDIKIGEWDVAKCEDWRKKTSAFLGIDSVLNFLTPEEYFYFVGSLTGRTEQEVAELLAKYENFFNDEILGKKKKCIRDFSSGNIQKIGIVAALISRPAVLLLDEPFNFLDPTSQMLLQEMLVDVNKNYPCTVIVSSHDITQLAPICDRAVLLEKGLIKHDFQASEHILEKLSEYFSPGRRIISQ